MEYDGQSNIRQYNVERVHLVDVKDDRRDHLDMSSEEIEEYQELLQYS